MSRYEGAASAHAAEPRLGAVVLAFAAVYVIWGSTYLAIRFAVETMPPLTMAATRFFVAGGSLYAWARATGAGPPTRTQWRDAAIVGTLLLAGGNGAVVVAEQWVASGLTALLVGSVPLWLVILDAAFGSRARPTRRATVGLALGFAGVALLTGAPGAGAGGSEELAGALLVLAGSFAWAAGSLFSRYTRSQPRPLLWVAMQMLCGAVSLSALAVAFGEPAGLDVRAISARSWWALAYLIVFGALIAYTAYIWLLGATSPARAGTYAYVNPVVALLLGWALADEPLSLRALAASAIILGAVVLITSEVGHRAGRGASARRVRGGPDPLAGAHP